jgi:hypothetical protein
VAKILAKIKRRFRFTASDVQSPTASRGRLTKLLPRSAPGVRFVRSMEFKPFSKNTLRAFFDLGLASGMILAGCTLHEKNGHHWVGLPAKPYLKDGVQTWAPIIDFRDKTTRERFQQQVTPLAVAALEQAQNGAAA